MPKLRLLLCLLAATGLLNACRESAPATPPTPSARQLAAADIATVRSGTLVDGLAFTGTLRAYNATQLASEIDATVKTVKVRPGQSVARGELLAELDTSVQQRLLDEQRAQLANQRARLALADKKLAQQRELFARGFISRLALDEQESAFRIQQGEVAAQLAQFERASKTLNDARIRAPQAGVVYQRNIEPGQLVKRNDVLFAIAELSTLELVASVPAASIARIQLGQRASFAVDALDTPFSAEVVRINPVAQSGTRSFEVYLNVANPSGQLKAGQFVRGQIELARRAAALIVPSSALNGDAGARWLTVVKGGKLQRQPVKVELAAASEAAISGIAAGSVVLRQPLLGSKPGDSVTLPNTGS